MTRKISKGKCENCGQIVAKNTMTRHIGKCVRGKDDADYENDLFSQSEIFHIQVDCGPMYWLHIDAPGTATLKKLDAFLRDIWLECCGHLSLFDIDGMEYYSTPDKTMGDSGMNFKIRDLLDTGMKFRHEYDFGSTTELILKVISIQYSAKAMKSIRLLARNEPPVIPCDICGKPAVQICCECVYEDEGCLCADCAEEHECDEEMFLPVVNSPRTGVCAYSG